MMKYVFDSVLMLLLASIWMDIYMHTQTFLDTLLDYLTKVVKQGVCRTKALSCDHAS